MSDDLLDVETEWQQYQITRILGQYLGSLVDRETYYEEQFVWLTDQILKRAPSESEARDAISHITHNLVHIAQSGITKGDMTARMIEWALRNPIFSDSAVALIAEVPVEGVGALRKMVTKND